MFAYPVPDRDHERLLHELEVLAQMNHAKPVPAPTRSGRRSFHLPRAIRFLAAH